jgi:hypothetical protein
MIRKLFVLLVIVMVSCEKKPDTPQEMILGNWSVVNKDSIKPWEKDITGFEFLPDSVCDYKPGYWDMHRYENERLTAIKNKNLKSLENEVLYYLGTKTKYKVSRDSLKVFNLTEKTWDAFKIRKLTNDSLVLVKDPVVQIFVKKFYDTTKNDGFDAVIVSSSSCYGSCINNDIIIHKNGDILYKGNFHVVKEGWHTAKISPSEYNVIMKRFKEADYLSLKNDYSIPVTDSQSISVSFLKDGKIIKTINDYADSAPNEFIWAYIPLVSLGQRLNLKPIDIKTYLDKDYFYSSFVSVDKVRGMDLSSSEVFYLVTLLMDAKDVNVKFDEKYILHYDTDHIREVRTDGRYYKLYLKNGKTEIKDIGFNFITDNKLKDKFEIIKR